MAAERGRATIPEERHAWRTKRLPMMRAACHRLVLLDETSVTTKMTRLRGRSRKGKRLHAKAPFGYWGTQTFIAGLRCDRLSAPWVIDKAMNQAAFETYVETQLAPTLHKGDVVILDNLEADRGEGRREAKPPVVDPDLTATEREELVRLRRENRQLKLERNILSRATA